MIDEAFKTHKETTFGWVLALQELWATLRAPAKPRKHPRSLVPR